MTKQLSFDLLVNNLAIGVCVLDADQRVSYANSLFGDLVGSSPVALVGKPSQELIEFRDEDGPGVEGCRAASLRTGAGKTECASVIAQECEEGTCLLVLPAASVEALRWGKTVGQLTRVEQLLDRVERMHSGAGSIGPDRDLSSSPLLAQLSRREREIVTALVSARPVKQIAATLNISPHTVRNHLKSSFRKLNVGSQVELVAKLTQGPALVSAIEAAG